MSDTRFNCFVYVALPCEAKPLLSHFGLKKHLNDNAFAVYSNNRLCLTVTGVGKSAMAAAIGYTQALYATVAPRVLLNAGIAGHASYALGQAYLIDKITDFDTGKNHYPPRVYKTTLSSAPLQTVSKPMPDYPGNTLFDMEASAFYETASRFSTGELIQCIKVISDNQESPVDAIQPQQVSALMAAHMPTIQSVLTVLQQQASSITPSEPAQLQYFTQRYRFTANETAQLRNQLARWQVLTDYAALDDSGLGLKNGAEVLRWLNGKISAVGYSI